MGLFSIFAGLMVALGSFGFGGCSWGVWLICYLLVACLVVCVVGVVFG